MGIEGDESKAPSHGRVNEGDRPISRVHCPNQVKVGWQGERLVPRRIQELYSLVSVLEQKVEFTEHLGQVGPVDLVNDQDECLVAMFDGSADELPEGTGLQLKSNRPAIAVARAVALKEIFIGVGGVKLDQFDLLRPDWVSCELACDVGLARPRWPIEI